MKTRRFITAPILLLALSCTDLGHVTNGEPVGQEGLSNVALISDEDALMNAARARARATFATFKADLAAHRPNSHYSVKLRFQDGDAVEHLWVDRLSYENGALTGIVDNEPVHVTNVRLGDRVSLTDDRVSDWLILHDGKYRGGFTIRYYRDKLTPSEQKTFDSQMGATPQ